jgi:transcriptional regulator with GAF, ATPase, and Fis domain
VDVRIISATHHNLEQMVAQGRFRADLYFRLAVVPLHLPPLRDRGDDVDLLVDLALTRVRERVGRNSLELDADARHAIRTYTWPGNVRELAHKMERAALLSRSARITESDLALPSASLAIPIGVGSANRIDLGGIRELLELADSTLDLRSALEQVERALIDRALSKANGNRTEAAALLGLNRTTLVEKLRKYAA